MKKLIGIMLIIVPLCNGLYAMQEEIIYSQSDRPRIAQDSNAVAASVALLRKSCSAPSETRMSVSPIVVSIIPGYKFLPRVLQPTSPVAHGAALEDRNNKRLEMIERRKTIYAAFQIDAESLQLLAQLKQSFLSQNRELTVQEQSSFNDMLNLSMQSCQISWAHFQQFEADYAAYVTNQK